MSLANMVVSILVKIKQGPEMKGEYSIHFSFRALDENI